MRKDVNHLAHRTKLIVAIVIVSLKQKLFH